MDIKYIVILLIMACLSQPILAASNLPTKALTASQFKQLIPKLHAGGHVLYFRHSQTDPNFPDEWPIDLNDCESQRRLTPAGRKLARDIGLKIKMLRLPIGQVVSSPFCRCINTAKLMFNKVRIDHGLYFAIGLTAEEKSQRGEDLRKLLQQPPQQGKNRVLVSHTANLVEAVGLWPKQEGVMYIFKTDHNGNIKNLGHVNPHVWPQLGSSNKGQ